jgi:carbon monoxide dehydrogenase subunit G
MSSTARRYPLIFEDRVTIPATAGRVWDSLLDVNCIAACMPGVEEVQQIDDRTFDGVIAASVGPISGKFPFRAHIVESDPPWEMRGEVKGEDSVTKSTITAEVTMALRPVGTEETELSYRATVDIRGRLAILGDIVLRTTAALMVDEFTKRLRRQLAVSEAGG